MFEFIRAHTRWTLGFVLLLIIPSFVFFGIDGYSRFTEGGNATVAEVDAARQQEEPDDDKQFARGACRVLCDKDGKRIFDATKPEDVDLLAAQPWSMLTKVIAASKPVGSDGDKKGN